MLDSRGGGHSEDLSPVLLLLFLESLICRSCSSLQECPSLFALPKEPRDTAAVTSKVMVCLQAGKLLITLAAT